jgi:hypothetical protein
VGRTTPYLPADAPVDGGVLPSWRGTVLEEHAGTTRINRQYYELCVLQRLERALKCKEVWVEGSNSRSWLVKPIRPMSAVSLWAL